MSKHLHLVTASLLDSFGIEVQVRRRHRNIAATKSMTRFTLLLMLLFCACWFHLWLR